MIKYIQNAIAVLLVISCGSIYNALLGGEFIFIPLLLFSCISLLIQSNYSLRILKSFTIATTVMTFFLVLNWILTGFIISEIEYPKYIFRVIVMNLSLFALLNRNPYFSYKTFEWVFAIISVHAFFNFVLCSTVQPLFYIVGSSDQSFTAASFLYVFFFNSFITVAGIDICRNQGFFWEPGVLGFILNIYLFIILIIKEKKNYAWILFVCFLIITTFSTTGLALMLLQAIYYFFQNRISVKKILMICVVGVALVPFFISNLKEKTSGDGEVSYIMRNYDSFIALDMIRNNPIVGIGLSSDRYKTEQQKYPRFFNSDLKEGRGNTNSILTIFVSFGIPLGALIMFLLYKQVFIEDFPKFAFVLFVVFLASEPLLMSGFFIMIMSSWFYRVKTSSLK
jgi:hypothetical protein